MKRFLLLLTFASYALFSLGQSTTPRTTDTKGRVITYTPTVQNIYVTDGSSFTDTVMISPGAYETNVFINSGDTLKNHICIGIKDSTALGRTKYFTDDNCYRPDRLNIFYTTTGLRVDTIDFYSGIQCDTLGSGNNKRRVILKDTNKTSGMMPFWFNGTTYIEYPVYNKPANASAGR